MKDASCPDCQKLTSGDCGKHGPRLVVRQEYAGQPPLMTLRDYFAAAALTGMMGHPELYKNDEVFVAVQAYTIADAMLAEREERP